MSFDILRNVADKFLAENRKTDVARFNELAMAGLNNFGYTGISYAGNDKDNMNFLFEGDIETVNLPDVESALDVLLNGYTDSSLTDLRLERLEEVNAFRDEWMSSWFPFAGHRWDCNAAGLTNIMGTNTSALLLGQMGQDLPSNFVFRDRDNNNVPANAAFMAGLGLTMFKFRSDCYVSSWIHKYMLAFVCSTLEDLKAYNIAVGWPTREV